MALNDVQVKWLEVFFAECEGQESQLNDWERGFVTDLQKRFEQYRQDVRISPKQVAVLKKIWKNLTGQQVNEEEGLEG